MQKFGLFDLIEKFLPQNKATNANYLNTEKPVPTSAQKPKISQENLPKSKSFAPYYLLIKRHDEISKRIDKLKK